MEAQAGSTQMHYAAHGSGTPILILHGAGVDHREPETCFEPMLEAAGGFRRIYPDLPGMGSTAATDDIRGADDVLDTLIEFVASVAPEGPYLLIGHSAGAYFAQAIAARHPERVAGLALVCPLLPTTRDVPEHRVVLEAETDLGDEEFRNYFVIHTPEMLARYERFVAPGAALVDETAMARIGEHWELTSSADSSYGGPTLIVAGRLDSVVGYSASANLALRTPSASLAILDGTGHALPHERPRVLSALILDWLARTRDPATTVPGGRATSGS